MSNVTNFWIFAASLVWKKLSRPTRQWTTSNFTFIGARMPGEKLQNWQNFEYSVACRYTHRVYRSALSLACESEPEVKSCIPNVTFIGASYRSCGAKTLKFDEIWNFWVPIATPFTDHGQMWHARVNLACQILLWSCRSREAKTLKFDRFFKFNSLWCYHLGAQRQSWTLRQNRFWTQCLTTISCLQFWRFKKREERKTKPIEIFRNPCGMRSPIHIRHGDR